MNEINFTVIIPHKNIPDLLVRCLDSIPRREDIQIIVVDDNSDPDKVDFANFPGLNDPYIEVIFGKNENGRKGAGYARNLGLERAKGKWLVFADADDFFTENAFEYLYENKDSECEIIYFKVTSCYSDTLEKADRDVGVNSLIDNYICKSQNAEDNIRYQYISPWGKQIKSKLVNRNQIKFEEVIVANDRMFSILSGHSASSINASNKTIYCITLNKGSITNTLNVDHLTSIYGVILRTNVFFRSINKKHYQGSIMHCLFCSLQYGFLTFLNFIKLAIIHKNNPFIGMSKWIYNAYIIYKRKQVRKKYIISK